MDKRYYSAKDEKCPYCGEIYSKNDIQNGMPLKHITGCGMICLCDKCKLIWDDVNGWHWVEK